MRQFSIFLFASATIFATPVMAQSTDPLRPADETIAESEIVVFGRGETRQVQELNGKELLILAPGASPFKAMGGNPEASFYVSFKPNAYAGRFKGKNAPLVGPSGSKGRNLGKIDMRAIAPTLAKILGTSLPSAEPVAVQ